MNTLAFTGIFFFLFIVLTTILADGKKKPSMFTAIIIAAEIVLLCSVFFWQRIRWYRFARIVLCAGTLMFIFFLSKIIKTDLYNYYFAALTILTLLFFDNKIIIYTGLITAILCFYYGTGEFDALLAFKFRFTHQAHSDLLLFIMTFLIVNYFKTVHEKREKSLEKKSRELETLNDFKSQFFISISHEIRTPLTLIQGNNELLGEHHVATYNPEIQEYHHNIKAQIAKIKSIVDNVMDLAKTNTNGFQLQKKDILLNDFLKRLYLSFHTAFQQKEIAFQYEDNPVNCTISADLVYLERSLNNMILNALKYTDKGGRVVIRSYIENNHKVIIAIKDTGIGMVKTLLSKVFDRFYQADNAINKASGSGIGLAFSKEVIAMHNGSIEVSSTPGKGSEFRIILPVISVEPETTVNFTISEIESFENEKSISYSTPIISKPRILIVDDHPEMRDYIQSLLRKYDCSHADDGITALEILKNQNIDLIITDYMMPNMDGYHLIQEIKKLNLNIPILMLTAREDMSDKLNVLRLEIDDYMTKPFNKNELIIKIQNALRNARRKKAYMDIEQFTIQHPNEKFLTSLKEYILTTCSESEFGLEDIAMEFAMSKSTIYRKIKSSTGLNPNQFINEIKLQKAKVMVESNQLNSLKQLSFAVGFTKPSYFSTLYEKRFGTKPFHETENMIHKK